MPNEFDSKTSKLPGALKVNNSELNLLPRRTLSEFGSKTGKLPEALKANSSLEPNLLPKPTPSKFGNKTKRPKPRNNKTKNNFQHNGSHPVEQDGIFLGLTFPQRFFPATCGPLYRGFIASQFPAKIIS
jgi:hypothetical protein